MCGMIPTEPAPSPAGGRGSNSHALHVGGLNAVKSGGWPSCPENVALLGQGPHGLALEGDQVGADVGGQLAEEQGPEQKAGLLTVGVIR